MLKAQAAEEPLSKVVKVTKAGPAVEDILERSDGASLTGLHFWIIALCAAAFAIDLMEMTLGGAMSAIFSAAPYRLDPQQVSWLLASVYVGAIIGAPIMGWLGDKCGPKAVLTIAILLLSLTSFLGAASPSPSVLTVFRFLSGLALGAIPPLMIAYLTDISPPTRRGLVIFLVCAIAYLAPPVGIFGLRWLTIAQPFGVDAWRWPLGVGGLISAFVGIGFLYIPEGPHWLLTVGKISSARTVFRDLATYRKVWKTSEPAARAKQVRSFDARYSIKRAIAIGLLYFLNPWAIVGFPLLTGPLLLARGFSLSDTLFFVGIATIGPVIGTMLAGLYVDRIHRPLALAFCGILMLGCVVTFFWARSEVLLAVSVLGFSLGVALYMPVMTIFGAEMFPASNRASTTSFAWALNRAASALAPLILLPLLDRGAAPVIVVIAVALAAGIGVAFIAARINATATVA